MLLAMRRESEHHHHSHQHLTDSPSSRRMLLDYPNPYLYSNHYHTSPSEDLVAPWFGSNGSGLPSDIGRIKLFSQVLSFSIVTKMVLKT
uniref:Uncharacterized protein n=1 Tax=Glossina palpalis gambiensis TaxID=67801 RepID=A0A1B0BSB1_9MUSC